MTDKPAKPTLVLLPGMDGTGELFQPLLAAIKDDWPVCVVRYPCEEPKTFDELVEYTRSLLPDGPLVLLGESFSGPVAASLAAGLGRRLKALIFVASFIRCPRPKLSSLAFLVSLVNVKLAARMAPLLLLGRNTAPELRQAVRMAVGRITSRVLQSRLRQVAIVDATPSCTSIECPTLYLQAANDRLVPASAGLAVQMVIPGARIVRLKAPHGLLQTRPEEAWREMHGFIASPCA
ncbi:alpha/beta fold hydrolase [Piscinibacter terrae]|uniref:Alpha/beta hydrolase n=1 Tax=Piscinibacter terrae TaxID=2496871 RepID=A0A3N7J3T7_9BURK|nr:alpha/beta hydrolase [Albitalea terrae]RQP25532.1 alpha/beta hydrolase [Albitalea terrae]